MIYDVVGPIEIFTSGKGTITRIGSKLYGPCGFCREVIRLNKPLLGSTHICKGRLYEGAIVEKDKNG